MILFAAQVANWQRAGGTSNPKNVDPEFIHRPSEVTDTAVSLPEEQPAETFTLESIRGELARRRAAISS